MNNAPVRVAVTGAAGQIGYSLLFRIAAGDMLGAAVEMIAECAAQAEMGSAQAQLSEAQANRRDLQIVAPMDGIVTRRNIEEGENVVFSWIEWPSKEVRDAGMRTLMEDERMKPDFSFSKLLLDKAERGEKFTR